MKPKASAAAAPEAESEPEVFLSPELDAGEVRGILEVMPDGFGFLRSANFLPGEEDIYVSPSQIRRFNLKTGDVLSGRKREKAQGEKYGALMFVSSVNGFSPEAARQRLIFEKMTPVFPDERIRLEREGCSRAVRLVDLISPIGKGQRGMIVSPPKAGKTTLLKDIANSILAKDPDANLLILLIDHSEKLLQLPDDPFLVGRIILEIIGPFCDNAVQVLNAGVKVIIDEHVIVMLYLFGLFDRELQAVSDLLPALASSVLEPGKKVHRFGRHQKN